MNRKYNFKKKRAIIYYYCVHKELMHQGCSVLGAYESNTLLITLKKKIVHQKPGVKVVVVATAAGIGGGDWWWWWWSNRRNRIFTYNNPKKNPKDMDNLPGDVCRRFRQSENKFSVLRWCPVNECFYTLLALNRNEPMITQHPRAPHTHIQTQLRAPAYVRVCAYTYTLLHTHTDFIIIISKHNNEIQWGRQMKTKNSQSETRLSRRRQYYNYVLIELTKTQNVVPTIAYLYGQIVSDLLHQIVFSA